MIVVLPFCHKDYARTQEQLRWMAELDGKIPDHHALLVASSQTPAEATDECVRLAKLVFSRVSAIRQVEVEESGWPRSCNRLFQLAASYIKHQLREPFYWMENDVVPLRPGWLDLLNQEYRNAGKPFMGVVYEWVSATRQLPHLTGCAIYPADLDHYNPQIIAADSIPWDCTNPRATLRFTHRTELMCHRWGNRVTNEAPTFPLAASLQEIPEKAVVFHRCKDGSLIQRLREQLYPGARPEVAPKRKLVESVKRAVVEVVKSRLELGNVTLVCVDTLRPDLAWKGVKACLDQVAFGDVQFFNHTGSFPHSIKIPELAGIDGYNQFVVTQLARHVKTSHALICQWDGFILNPKAWSPEFLKWDYIGAPWRLPNTHRRVGNGGFSLRTAKLLQQTAQLPPPYHPEDQMICVRHAAALESAGVRFAPGELASTFSCELGQYQNQFGFHSFQTKLPAGVERPAVFHHSGHIGDILYACAAIADFGLGCLYISPEIRGPRINNVGEFVKQNRYNHKELAGLLSPLLRLQPYIADCRMANNVPSGTDVDFNLFRLNYKPNGESLVHKQCATAGAQWPDEKPWLQVDFVVSIKERPIVIHRSQRYHNPDFPWRQLVHEHGSQMVMVGTKEEHQEFIGEFGVVPHLPTPGLLDLARVIAGAKVFIGNQSSPMALALGLGRPVIQEVFQGDPNCQLRRPRALYISKGEVEIPKRWLK